MSFVRFFACWAYFALATPLLAALVEDPLHHEEIMRQAQDKHLQLPVALAISGNAIINGEFNAALANWNTTGSVQSSSAEAEVTDVAVPGPSLMYQSIALSSGVYTISFDFSSGLSSNVAPGTFPDTFFASLYFIDGTGQIDVINQVFDDTFGLMDVDAAGPFNVLGLIGPSIKGPEWQHFSHNFNLTYDQVAVAFELAGLNGASGDSSVRIDNVAIVLVPEPAALSFVMTGLLLLLLRRRIA